MKLPRWIPAWYYDNKPPVPFDGRVGSVTFPVVVVQGSAENVGNKIGNVGKSDDPGEQNQ